MEPLLFQQTLGFRAVPRSAGTEGCSWRCKVQHRGFTRVYLLKLGGDLDLTDRLQLPRAFLSNAHKWLSD